MPLLKCWPRVGNSFVLKSLAVLLMLAFGSNVPALPVGGVVAAGGATINSTAGSTTITQSTRNVAINWQSFSIGLGEAVKFVQPGSNSVALNRVLGADPSSILGSMSANGKVFLVNPSGILFGKGAQVNVGGLLASTLNITDSDFMAGRYRFAGTSGASVLNQGSINAEGGYVALLGANVSNEGIILARLGTVALASGRAMTLDAAGDGLLNVTVSQGAVNALIQNGGLIQADGGQVLLTAKAAGTLLLSAVNNTGVIQAQTIENRNGTIRLIGDTQGGTVNVGGRLDASAPRGGDGGFIETSAVRVNVADKAIVATQSAQGRNGIWLIDPFDFTIATLGGNMTPFDLVVALAGNVTISSNQGNSGILGDIKVRNDVRWAGATTLTLNAVHDVLVDAAITADTAGAGMVLKAGHDVAVAFPLTTVAAGTAIKINGANDVRIGAAVTLNAAGSAIDFSAGRDLITTAPINAVAANSKVALKAGNDARVGGLITATAANSSIAITATHDVITTGALNVVAGDSAISVSAGHDATIGGAISATAATSAINIEAGHDLIASAAIAAAAAGSSIRLTAGHDVSNTVTGAISGGAATTGIELKAGHDVNVNAAIAAGAAGSWIKLIAGLDGSGPGSAGGTVHIAGAVASPSVTIRFNPNGYANTAAEIALYPALADARAWVFLKANDKTYDGTRVANLSFRGMLAGDGAVTLVPGIASFSNKNAGGGKTVSFNGFALGGADSGKFALFANTGTVTANIAKGALIVTAAGTNKSYDGTTAAVVTLSDNRITGDMLTLSSAIASFADRNVGNAKEVSIGGISVTGTDAANYSFTAPARTTANIAPAPLIVKAGNATRTYGQTSPLSAFVATGLVNGETIGSVTETSAGAAATAGVAGGAYAITPSRATGGTFTASNYVISYVNGALTVVPMRLTVTVANASKFFGESATLTGFSVEGLMNDDTIDALSETSPGAAASASVAGSPYVITPGKVSGGTSMPSNYTIAYVNGLLAVLPVSVTRTVVPAQLTPVLPATAPPALPGDTQ